MTHNRKPDVLPVEGASIAEALKAVAELEEGVQLGYLRRLEYIRSVLERAAAEGEAWRVIEPWCRQHPGVGPVMFVDDDGFWTFQITNEFHEWVFAYESSTRLEALQAAAEWVKAQAPPAPPKGSTP